MLYAYRRRTFLNPISTEFPSYVMAFVEKSDGGEYRLGTNILTIADCHRRVEFEFFLGTPQHRRRSLAKINLLIDVLTGFKKALERESKLIDQYSKKQD